MLRILIVSSFLTAGLNEYQFHQAQAQVNWDPVDKPKAQPSLVIWEGSKTDSEEPLEPSTKWEVVLMLVSKISPSIDLGVLKSEDEVLLHHHKQQQIR